MGKKITFITATLVFGIIIFALVLKLTGFKDLFSSFKDFSVFPFIAFVIVSFFMQAAGVYRWKVILGAHNYNIGFWKLFTYKIAGFSMCYITPGALVGGEALRAYLLKRDKVPMTKGISSVIIDKFFDLAIAAIFTSIGLIVIISFFDISEYLKSVLLLLTVIWLVFLSFFLYGTLTRKGFFKHIFMFFRLYKIKYLTKAEGKIKETEDNMSNFFLEHKSEFQRAVVISLILWILMFIEYKIATVVFGYDAGFIAVFLIICMVGLSYTMPVPGALGILEATQASVHTLIGLKAAYGIALSLLIRARDIGWTLMGIAFTYFHGVSLAKQISKPSKK